MRLINLGSARFEMGSAHAPRAVIGAPADHIPRPKSLKQFMKLVKLFSLLAAALPAFAAAPQFSLAWSEYPSWSVFGVAHMQKLIDGAAGKQGPLETKWNIDIVLKE